MSMARQILKSPRSLSSTPTHPTMVTQRFMSQSWTADSRLFPTMTIGPSILEIRLFQTLTLKFQGQGHWYGQRTRPCRPSIWFTYFSLHINHTNKSWDTTISKFDLVSVQCISFWCVNRTNHSRDMTNRVFDHEKNALEILKKNSPKKSQFPTELLQYLIRY